MFDKFEIKFKLRKFATQPNLGPFALHSKAKVDTGL